MADTTQNAISSALRGDWKQAIDLNLCLLKSNSKDIDALNRLGRAYLETNQKTKSLEIYTKVLSLDKYNPIATKALGIIKTFKANPNRSASKNMSAPIFLEEPGVTKTVILTRLGDFQTLSRLHPGDEVILSAHEHCVSICSTTGDHLGRLPDDLASRMRIFIKAGNKYKIWVKSVDPKSPKPALKVFIKEVSRVQKFKNSPSFPLTEKLSYAAFTPPELVHLGKPNIETTEKQDIGDEGFDSSTIDSEELEEIPTADEN